MTTDENKDPPSAKRRFALVWLAGLVTTVGSEATAQPMFPGGSLSPDEVPKYVIPLVLPQVMPNNGKKDEYDIAVRQFSQQILPGGIWEAGCVR